MWLVVGVLIVPVGLMAVLGPSWPLVALAAWSFIAGVLATGLTRASAAGDRQMAEPIDDLDLTWQAFMIAVERDAARETYELDLPLR
jgi:hypothetical protein